MDYLVEMKVAGSARPTNLQEGLAFIEQYVVPSLEVCKRLEAEGKIVAGGPVSGTMALAFLVRVDSVQELDDIVESLPIWPRMDTTVSTLTTFDGRISAVSSRLERIKTKLQNQRAGTT